MPGTPCDISVRGLGKRFADGTVALDDVTLDLPAGQIVALLGPSGAGKTTFLRCLNRLVEPSAGRILLGGADVTAARGAALRALRRRMGMVFQQFNLVPGYTAFENVLVGIVARQPSWRVLARRFPPDAGERAAVLLAEVGLLEKAHAPARDLSGGQQQRVALARALAQEPDVLLADEPAASLDPRLARTVLDLLRDVTRERGLTLLLNLHSVEHARAYADRVIALRAGRVALDGPPSQFDAAALETLYGDADSAARAATGAPAGATTGATQ